MRNVDNVVQQNIFLLSKAVFQLVGRERHKSIANSQHGVNASYRAPTWMTAPSSWVVHISSAHVYLAR